MGEKGGRVGGRCGQIGGRVAGLCGIRDKRQTCGHGVPALAGACGGMDGSWPPALARLPPSCPRRPPCLPPAHGGLSPHLPSRGGLLPSLMGLPHIGRGAGR